MKSFTIKLINPDLKMDVLKKLHEYDSALCWHSTQGGKPILSDMSPIMSENCHVLYYDVVEMMDGSKEASLVACNAFPWDMSTIIYQDYEFIDSDFASISPLLMRKE